MTTNDEGDDRLARIEGQLREIGERLAAVEQAGPRHAPPAPGAWTDTTSGAPGGPADGPADGSADGPPGGPGWPEAGDATFSYSGYGRFGKRYLRARQRWRMSDVLGADPDLVARVFAALASPARIIVLRALLDGPRTSQQLRAELDDASVGQLYHHLRELLAAGLITQPARSQYAIPGGKPVALCLQIIAAAQLSSDVPRPDLMEEDPAAGEASG